ncbi:MAG: WbqC family protein [Bacteroidota bacterium]|nr:WbqC family protein [Bacteroidota bacterium]
MKLAIMQPYVFPYIGYFQLIHAVDLFVFYNDVNFIKKGWIHRNKILVNSKEFLFTIPCTDASQNKRICDTRISFGAKERSKLLATVRQAYAKAPFFNVAYKIVENVLSGDYTFIDEMAIRSVKEVCGYLDVATKFRESNDRYHNSGLMQADRLIDICLQEKADHYINAVGGREIYSKERFDKSGIALNFLETTPGSYRQFDNEFVPFLSIIDVLMFNQKEEVKQMLDLFELV